VATLAPSVVDIAAADLLHLYSQSPEFGRPWPHCFDQVTASGRLATGSTLYGSQIAHADAPCLQRT
jgi:hypothetical protein